MRKHLAFSFRQPWASLCAIGATKYVTWTRPPFAGALDTRIAIYAAKRPATYEDLDPRARDAVGRAFGRADWADALPFAAVVGTALLRGAYHIAAHDRRGLWVTYDRVVGGVPRHPVERGLKVDLLGNYRPGLWAWLIEEPFPFDPAYRAHGWRGWWEWIQPTLG
jgi:hypothetical protein